jgi:hypothetical protein
MMAEQGPLTFDERMKVIETVLADLELTSRLQADVNSAVDYFAAGVGKIVTRLRLEIDVARESRDNYRVKRDLLREELARSSSQQSLSSQRSLASSAPMSDSTRSDVQYAALSCQPEFLDGEVSVSPRAAPQGPFRIASLRSPQPQSPPIQKPKPQSSPVVAAAVVASPVPAKPSRANKPAAAPAPIAASSPTVKPAVVSPRSLHPSQAPAKPTKVAKPMLNSQAPATVKAPNASYVEFVFPGDRERDRNSDSHQTMYGGFGDDGQSEFGEFPPSEFDNSE